MSLPARTLSLIPESAPFSAEQRVWLDGLFAGLLSLEHGVTPLSLEQAAALLPGGLDLASPPSPEDDDGAPWHDPALALRCLIAAGPATAPHLVAALTGASSLPLQLASR